MLQRQARVQGHVTLWAGTAVDARRLIQEIERAVQPKADAHVARSVESAVRRAEQRAPGYYDSVQREAYLHEIRTSTSEREIARVTPLVSVTVTEKAFNQTSSGAPDDVFPQVDLKDTVSLVLSTPLELRTTASVRISFSRTLVLVTMEGEDPVWVRGTSSVLFRELA